MTETMSAPIEVPRNQLRMVRRLTVVVASICADPLFLRGERADDGDQCFHLIGGHRLADGGHLSLSGGDDLGEVGVAELLDVGAGERRDFQALADRGVARAGGAVAAGAFRFEERGAVFSEERKGEEDDEEECEFFHEKSPFEFITPAMSRRKTGMTE